jgi:hypothetical protein
LVRHRRTAVELARTQQERARRRRLQPRVCKRIGVRVDEHAPREDLERAAERGEHRVVVREVAVAPGCEAGTCGLGARSGAPAPLKQKQESS